MNYDEVIYSLKNLKNRKMRSFLTVLSILIGVMAIFAILSFGFGIQNYVDVLGEQAGVDKFFVQSRGVGAPGTDETFSLSQDEVDFIGKINGVKEISGMYAKSGQIKLDKEQRYTFVIGMEMKKIDFILETFTIGMEKGRNLKPGEVGKVALGYNYQIADKIFKKPLKLGDKIEVNGHKLEVVGFFEEVGNPQDDSQVYLTMDGFEAIYPDSKDKFGYIMGQGQKGEDMEELTEKIESKLRKYKGQDEGKETFFVQTFQDILETFNVVIGVLNAILFLIALISVVVASVNIMNTMYTAVVERTKEIGIMKAIGAKNRDILFVFIFESGFLGMLGGVIGVFLGYLVSSAGGAAAAAFGYSSLQPIFPIYLIVGCIMFAFVVGAGSGILPAVQASKLKPVDALRYE